jgi:hypothetical protein
MHSAGRGPWPHGARPTCAALVRPTASAGHSARSLRARCWPSSASAERRARRTAALLGEPAVARHRRTETTGKRWLTDAKTAAWLDGDGNGRARRGGGSGDGSARTAGARTRPVGAAAALVRQLSVEWVRGRDVAASARRGRAGGRGVRGSCWAWRCRGVALSRRRFKLCCRRGTWRPRGSGVLPHGPGAARDS